jgi:hypothetical protein
MSVGIGTKLGFASFDRLVTKGWNVKILEYSQKFRLGSQLHRRRRWLFPDDLS